MSPLTQGGREHYGKESPLGAGYGWNFPGLNIRKRYIYVSTYIHIYFICFFFFILDASLKRLVIRSVGAVMMYCSRQLSRLWICFYVFPRANGLFSQSAKE